MAERATTGGWVGFAAMAFIIAGLSGVFATYALPIPLERAFARDAVLDDALAALRGPNPAAALEALRPRLGDSADTVLRGPGTPEERIQRERAAMRAQFRAEAEATAVRLRWLCVMISLTGAVFVGALMGSLARRAAQADAAAGGSGAGHAGGGVPPTTERSTPPSA